MSDSDSCWDHIHDKEGYASSIAERLAGGEDLSGCHLQKVVLKGLRAEKAVLRKADLSQADLSCSHMFDVKLEGAELVGTDLSGCDLTHCDMRGADLTKARLAGARLWNADLRGANLIEADISGTDLLNARLFNVKLWHTEFNGAKSLGERSFSKERKMLDNPRIDETGLLSARESYRSLKGYFISHGMYDDASWASFKEKSMERLLLKKNGDPNYLPSLLMNILCGYGEKPYRIVLSAVLTIVLFATAYFALNAVEYAKVSGSVLEWTDYLYYSTITFTTVGYGDIVPKPTGTFRMLAAAEAFAGVFLTGLFIFTLARKYSAR